MFLKKLSIINFKNIENASLEFDSRVNCFVGDNGAGKTNILDAIYYLSMCKSVFSMTDRQCLRHAEEFFVLDGDYLLDSSKREVVVCGFKKLSSKTFKRNSKEYERLSDHIGLIPLVIVSPNDSFLISDAADERRKYLNSFLSQLDKDYITAVIKYNHLLGERNKLLKSQYEGSNEVFEVLDMQLVSCGEIIFNKRAALIERLGPLVARYYALLSGDREQVELSYRSDLHTASFHDLLSISRERDMINQHTTRGVHRDDLLMTVDGFPIKKYGSQGQQKSFLVALKLAQYMILLHSKDEKPILLLDDLFDKLDMARVKSLIELVSSGEFGQIFITDCNKVRLQTILEQSAQSYALFSVINGVIKSV